MSADPADTAANDNIEEPEDPHEPRHLWKVLEEEFTAIHKSPSQGADAFVLSDHYKAGRNRKIREVKDELRKSIETQLREEEPEIDARILAEETARKLREDINFKPSLINAPVCNELFQEIHKFVEAKPENAVRHSALCLSGGGIRSATFALGVLQGLARNGVLKEFGYLSTVSGGGYIGSWLSSWMKRDGRPKVLKALRKPEKPAVNVAENVDLQHAGGDEDPQQPFDTEPTQLRHLREYSNNSPAALGVFSGGGWAVAAIWLRNVLITALPIIPLLLFVLTLPLIVMRWERDEVTTPSWTFWTVFPAWLAFGCGLWSLTALLGRCGRTRSKVLWMCLLPLAAFCACAAFAWFRTVSAGGTPTLPHWLSQLLTACGLSALWCSGTQALCTVWGAVTALIAVPIGTYLRQRDEHLRRLENDDGTRVRWVFCYFGVVVVFALTGLAASAMSHPFAAPIAEARQAYVRSKIAEARQAFLRSTIPEAGNAHVDSKQEVEQSWIKLYAVIRNEFSEVITGRNSWFRCARDCVCFGPPFLITLVFLASTVLTGLLSRTMPDEDREWLARTNGWALLLAVVTCIFNCIVAFGPWALVILWHYSKALFISVGGTSGLITILGGQSDKSGAPDKDCQKPASTDRIVQLLVKFATPIFIVFLLMLLSCLSVLNGILLEILFGTGMPSGDADPSWHITLASLSLAAAAYLVLAAFLGFFVNINKFSLHAIYRNRLLRAYLGATHTDRVPNSFTGFDESDNLHMADLRDQRPFHVLNASLKLVHGTQLAWRQRRASSFTFTPFTAGSATLGYRDSKGYAIGSNGIPITLGTAMALSGAAVSPNQGYNSSPIIAVLLTFFNARLGGWFGNPGLAGEHRWPWEDWCSAAWRQAAPRWALWPPICEALGLTDAHHPYVYLSDGRHFENLGLYEMVLRRCHFIVVSDAGCDPAYTFENLANAISRIRVDLGVPIEFKPDIEIKDYPGESAGRKKRPGRHCAIGRIRYSQVDGPSGATKEDEEKRDERDGWLIYLKPAMCGCEPMDVFHYHGAHPDFPHEPTTDQWFSESQFESYRILGLHTIERICQGGNVTGLHSFRKQVKAYLAGKHD